MDSITQADREAAALACRLTGWRTVAERMERGWTPDPDTNEGKIIQAFARHRAAHSGEEKCTVCGIANQGHHVHTAPFTENYHQFSGEGRSNGAGEDALASIVVKLSAIRTVLREAHWALDDSEDLSHQDPPVHAVPLDNVMRLHRALRACERFAPKDAAWDGPGPLVTQIIEQLGYFIPTPSQTGEAK